MRLVKGSNVFSPISKPKVMRTIIFSIFTTSLIFIFSCNTDTPNKAAQPQTDSSYVNVPEEKDDVVAPPITAEPPPPPPPPPIIEEVPEEELLIEEPPEFVDQDPDTNVKYDPNASNIQYSKRRTPGYPPSPPPATVVEETVFKSVEPPLEWNTESYRSIVENEFKAATDHPLSTFSVDVDNASYSNSRRYLNNGKLPPAGAVRIEEFINYFDYDYPQPKGEVPFSVNTELSECPWNKGHKLVHIGLQGLNLDKEEIPSNNLVFLLDVSGSMDAANKLPLLKKSFRLLTKQLRAEDRIAIVVYAGASGLVLPSTPGDQKAKILAALDQLYAGGGTAGAKGIQLAYKVAQQNFIQNGNNRIILATDGDFNIGMSSDADLVKLIEDKRESGVFLSVLGFGGGNYKDSKMEQLADNGNGNYSYIDNLMEAKKVLVNEFSGTLFTIAKDVKIQVEFNPTKVESYRLVGYENRLLAKEDFNNDKKDAGEIGAGHTVTALYEIIPVGSPEQATASTVNPLKYQTQQIKASAAKTNEWLTINLRYKKPEGTRSTLISFPVEDAQLKLAQTSENYRFSAAVAGFAMLLRNSKFIGNATYAKMADLARNSKGKDWYGYRAEFIQLVEMAATLDYASN